uniref:Major intrinsic protein n=1 Tax=viral metagenome TaxID=1070528 RepID=A0A6C0DJT3_9ZZZZ
MNTLALVAEFFGTFLLLMSIFVTGNAFVIGGTLALIILLLGGISGAHVNPAVSVAMLLKGAIGNTELVTYIVAQCAGAAAAWYAYKTLA